jgi:hypothetical protein
MALRFHTGAYANIQVVVALRSHRHEYYTGQHVGHSPTPNEKIADWLSGEGSRSFGAFRSLFYFDEHDEVKKKKLDRIAMKAEEIIRQLGGLGACH